MRSILSVVSSALLFGVLVGIMTSPAQIQSARSKALVSSIKTERTAYAKVQHKNLPLNNFVFLLMTQPRQ